MAIPSCVRETELSYAPENGMLNLRSDRVVWVWWHVE
jgi:hypothetical protein